MRCSLLRLAAAVALLAAAAPAWAEPQRSSSLGWVRLPGAEACIGAPELSRAVEQQLGRAVFVAPSAADVVIEGRVESLAPGPGFHARLALLDGRGAVLGTRDLQSASPSCRALDEQLALVVAVLIDPTALLRPPSAPSPAPPIPPPTPQPLPPLAPPLPSSLQPAAVLTLTPALPPPPPPRPWRTGLALGGAVAAGLLPGVRGALVLRGEVTPPGFVPIQLGGALWTSARVDVGGKGATLRLAWGTLSVCPLVWRPGSTELRGCAGAALGAVAAEGYGFRLSTGREQLVAAGILEGRVTQRLAGPLEVGLGLGLGVPIVRARFYYLDASRTEQEIARTGAVAGLVDLGVGVSFP